jgi:xanthosine utilization system XapX-like protein
MHTQSPDWIRAVIIISHTITAFVVLTVPVARPSLLRILPLVGIVQGEKIKQYEHGRIGQPQGEKV